MNGPTKRTKAIALIPPSTKKARCLLAIPSKPKTAGTRCTARTIMNGKAGKKVSQFEISQLGLDFNDAQIRKPIKTMFNPTPMRPKIHPIRLV